MEILKYEEELIKACSILHKNLRENDFFTRMAVNGFYIVISGERSEEEQFTERFKRLFADRSLYQVGSYRLIGDPSPTDWLSEIDDQYFADQFGFQALIHYPFADHAGGSCNNHFKHVSKL